MKIKVRSVGETEFDLDAEYQAPDIRSAIAAGEDVEGAIIDCTGTERSDISHGEHATVSDPDGTVLWSGWLHGGPPVSDPECTVCKNTSSPHGVPPVTAPEPTPGQAASPGEVYWLAARKRKIAQGGTAPSSWASLDGQLREICEAGAAAVAAHALAAQEQPAPGPLALQLIIAVDALRDIADEPHPGFGPVRASKALDDIGTPGFDEPQPAPELAAAMAETRQVRSVLNEVLMSFEDSRSNGWYARVSGTVLNRWCKRAGVTR